MEWQRPAPVAEVGASVALRLRQLDRASGAMSGLDFGPGGAQADGTGSLQKLIGNSHMWLSLPQEFWKNPEERRNRLPLPAPAL